MRRAGVELEVVPRQAGAPFTINGIVAGLDVFDSPRALGSHDPQVCTFEQGRQR